MVDWSLLGALLKVAGAAVIFAERSALQELDVERVPSYFDLPAALHSR